MEMWHQQLQRLAKKAKMNEVHEIGIIIFLSIHGKNYYIKSKTIRTYRSTRETASIRNLKKKEGDNRGHEATSLESLYYKS